VAPRDPTHNPIRLARARRLRREATDAERLLWRYLRSGQLGEKFRRQHRLGQFIVDFFCPKRALAIELDGGQHFTDRGLASDARRTETLAALGVRVLRFSDAQMLTETEAVLDEIRKLLAG
jgi:very-short-patch-repair endonuclease